MANGEMLETIRKYVDDKEGEADQSFVNKLTLAALAEIMEKLECVENIKNTQKIYNKVTIVVATLFSGSFFGLLWMIFIHKATISFLP